MEKNGKVLHSQRFLWVLRGGSSVWITQPRMEVSSNSQVIQYRWSGVLRYRVAT